MISGECGEQLPGIPNKCEVLETCSVLEKVTLLRTRVYLQNVDTRAAQNLMMSLVRVEGAVDLRERG